MARPKRKIEKERERHCSPQMEDRLSQERKDSLRLLSLPFMRAGPLILHGSCQDPTEMHRRNLHTRSSGISSTRLPPLVVLPRLLSLHFSSAIHLTSLGCTTCFSSSSFFFFFSFFDAIATLLCTDHALFVFSSLLFEFPEKPRLFDRRKLCTAIRQVSKGAQTDRILRTKQWRWSPSNYRSRISRFVVSLTINVVTIKNDRDESNLDTAQITATGLARKNCLLYPELQTLIRSTDSAN